MAQVRALVTLRLVSDIESAAALMRRVTVYTEENFGGQFRFQPFINEESGKVLWLNSAADEETLVEWEQAMRETGLRGEAMGPTSEPVSVELLDPITDPRLDTLRDSTQFRSFLD